MAQFTRVGSFLSCFILTFLEIYNNIFMYNNSRWLYKLKN